MKREDQIIENQIVTGFVAEVNEKAIYIDCKRLRTCTAEVITAEDKTTGEIFYLLRSYNTIIAGVRNGIGYDFLREVYGYTATSAQHIAKFFNDYGAHKRYRFYYI